MQFIRDYLQWTQCVVIIGGQRRILQMWGLLPFPFIFLCLAMHFCECGAPKFVEAVFS